MIIKSTLATRAEQFKKFKDYFQYGEGLELNLNNPLTEEDNLLVFAFKQHAHHITHWLVTNNLIDLTQANNQNQTPLLLILKHIYNKKRKNMPVDLIAAILEKLAAAQAKLPDNVIAQANILQQQTQANPNTAFNQRIITGCELILDYAAKYSLAAVQATTPYSSAAATAAALQQASNLLLQLPVAYVESLPPKLCSPMVFSSSSAFNVNTAAAPANYVLESTAARADKHLKYSIKNMPYLEPTHIVPEQTVVNPLETLAAAIAHNLTLAEQTTELVTNMVASMHACMQACDEYKNAFGAGSTSIKNTPEAITHSFIDLQRRLRRFKPLYAVSIDNLEIHEKLLEIFATISASIVKANLAQTALEFAFSLS
jgi:hypothetical protein